MKFTFAKTEAFEQYNDLALNDRKMFQKLISLLKDIERTPLEGIGKPEPFKYDKSGWWSRRITNEHRLVYRIKGDTIETASCKYHYE